LRLDLLDRMIDDPDLQMEYRREVKAALAGKLANNNKG